MAKKQNQSLTQYELLVLIFTIVCSVVAIVSSIVVTLIYIESRY